MKTVKFLMVTAMLAMSIAANAQFANQSSKSSNKGGSSKGDLIVKDCENYNRFSISYTPLTMSYSYEGKSKLDKDETLPGLSLGWTGGFAVSKSIPFFIETGLNLSFNTKKITPETDSKNDDDDYDYYGYDDDYDYYDYDDEYKEPSYRHTTMGVAIPLGVSYKLTFKNGVYVAPYAGVHFKFNVLGKTKFDTDNDSDDDDDYYGYYDDDEEDSKSDNTRNWFDKKDMGGKNYTYNRFQMGWRIGGNIGYKNLNFNVGYAGDFTPLWKYKKEKLKTGGVIVGLGYNF